jgi:epoxide hydrolase-like predicted phosphatase
MVADKRPTPPIDAVIFDLGGVLISFDFKRSNLQVAEIVSLPPEEVNRRLIEQSQYEEFECGKITERQYHANVETALGHKLPYETFHRLWNDIFTAEIAATVALISVLRKKGIKTGLLSNTNVLHFEHLKPKLPVLKEIDHVFASHEIGFRKPDPKSYQHVLKNMNVAAARSVFVDDLEVNITGAKNVGMHGIHATHADAVQAGMKELGLI